MYVKFDKLFRGWSKQKKSHMNKVMTSILIYKILFSAMLLFFINFLKKLKYI